MKPTAELDFYYFSILPSFSIIKLSIAQLVQNKKTYIFIGAIIGAIMFLIFLLILLFIEWI